jgi:glycosyltransferase involved in cell wall biosynthesis
MNKKHKIAILIPCFNEEKTIANVINDFRLQLPDADIYVFDNNSTDNTVSEALRSGAKVRYEKRQGKGNVVRSMFRKVDADIFVMVDGDGTYPADKVPELIRPVIEDEADMVIGSRLHAMSESRFKPLNRTGNKMFLFILNNIFKVNITDLLSGYRAFNRQVVKNLPVLSRGFEIETELTVKCIERRYRIFEVPVNLSSRPEGSKSKIKIFGDGFRIFNTIFALFRDYKPLTVFGILGLIFAAGGFIPGIIVVREFILTGYISRVPSAILAVGLVLSGLIILFFGLVLHSISRRFQELDYQFQNINEKVQQLHSEQRDKLKSSP